jgi:hypothetical protein
MSDALKRAQRYRCVATEIGRMGSSTYITDRRGLTALCVHRYTVGLGSASVEPSH